jgi:hypothetical protein
VEVKVEEDKKNFIMVIIGLIVSGIAWMTGLRWLTDKIAGKRK